MKREEKKEILEKEKYKKLQINYKVPKPLILKKEKTEINDKEKKNRKGIIKSCSYSDILRQKMLIKFNITNISLSVINPHSNAISILVFILRPNTAIFLLFSLQVSII